MFSNGAISFILLAHKWTQAKFTRLWRGVMSSISQLTKRNLSSFASSLETSSLSHPIQPSRVSDTSAALIYRIPVFQMSLWGRGRWCLEVSSAAKRKQKSMQTVSDSSSLRHFRTCDRRCKMTAFRNPFSPSRQTKKSAGGLKTGLQSGRCGPHIP